MTSTPPTLRDVAVLAGVSQKTVSNVVNDYPHVSEATRHKVSVALKTLNYRANPSARSLASGRTGFIALMVPSIANPYFAELAGRVIDAAARHKWTVLIEQTRGSRATETHLVGSEMPHLVDGIIMHPEALTTADLEERMISTPLVLIGERKLEQIAHHVVADNVQAAYELTKHLLDEGRTKIALVGISEHSHLDSSVLRFRGFREAIEEAGLTVSPQHVVTVGSHERADGARAAERLMSSPIAPDAILCFNDVLAVGVLSYLNRVGHSVPDDVAIAAFDNIAESLFTSPPLTTVEWATQEIAEFAVMLLAEHHNHLAHRNVSVGYRIHVRGSSRAELPGYLESFGR